MAKKAAVVSRAKRTRRANRDLAATIAKLDQIEPATAKIAKALALFKCWLTDESGYDEKAWPRLKKTLELERQRVDARRLFDA